MGISDESSLPEDVQIWQERKQGFIRPALPLLDDFNQTE
jgi:hypothetical protein